MQDEVRILVADDHGMVRMGLIQEMKQLKPRAEIYEVRAYDALYKLVAKYKFYLAILDVKRPNGSFQEAIEYIRFKQPERRILVFSSQDEQLYADRYLKMAADGFHNK